jgi:DNA-directed RNA polymerase specialized sigma24 family protein
LAPFDATAAARRLAEVEADAELVQRAMWSGFRGPDWDEIAHRLAAYGLAVMGAWIATGVIYDRCESKGYRLGRVRFPPDVVDDLATDTVAHALVRFRDTVLAKGIWRPDGGASLTTFFIGQCLIRYPNIHRAHLRAAAREAADRRHRVLPADDVDADILGRLAHPGPPTADRVAAKLESLDTLRSLDRQTRSIVVYRSSGYSWVEVADLTGLSVTAAKSRLHRASLQATDGRAREERNT